MKTYEFNNGMLTVYSNLGVKDYCYDNHYHWDEFNEVTIIAKGVTDCSYMFEGCEEFNHPVTIPDGVTDCSYMFDGCYTFNHPVEIPNGVKKCNSMFKECHSLSQLVTIPDSVTDCSGMFDGTPLKNEQPATKFKLII